MMNDELMGRFYRAMQAESQEREIPCQRDIFDGCPEASYLIDYARRKDAPIYAVKRLLCANVNVEKSEDCKKSGTFICTKCRLVSYCSKECQTVHWSAHKQDCKDRLLSKDWRPCWAVEGRSPSFLDKGPESQFERWDTEELSMGPNLWGNMAAMDIVNLPNNEADSTKDLTLAFIASGDLRNVVRTIALPSDYSGKLKILMNDKLSYLLILPFISDDSEGLSFPLGPRSTLLVGMPPESIKAAFANWSTCLSTTETRAEYHRMRKAPSRRDFYDRMYANLRPSHRVAFQGFRRSGVVLPFGASHAHFDIPNATLFSGNGKWLQRDYADPLSGWNPDEVIKAGKAHGAQAEDIYGCLYFFLLDELSSFARRLRQLRITFNIYNLTASDLSLAIRHNSFWSEGIPASIRFDRIEVSNILDVNYIGIRGVVSNWASLLSKSSSATILGYFMNWTMLQEDGDMSTGKDLRAVQRVARVWAAKMKAEGRQGDPVQLLLTSLPDLNALNDNSGPFMRYLNKQGLDGILQSTKLKLRKTHTIVPHRNRAPLSGSLNALPEFPDRDSWYYHVRVIFAYSSAF
ncbi:hypothetical protein Agabi119p4_9122 [Agaricus bisporus var. burnettii]|uniref:MYND-type domain-containing protein n=1 Tax=Agaricus bisporus var. burnettii TaxID=192524 RepID=A0A8H7C6P6_AGABI|nr:hypothetical protein Agabi119p4_9122 [Agaricus bisporus var. burnettii]